MIGICQVAQDVIFFLVKLFINKRQVKNADSTIVEMFLYIIHIQYIIFISAMRLLCQKNNKNICLLVNTFCTVTSLEPIA